jgi:hypothetical protein
MRWTATSARLSQIFTYFPFNAKLCLNGHEYAKRQLARKGIVFEALDNGILSCAFRAADLRQHLAALSGRNPEAISQGAITYQLRRRRLHGLIERLPNSFRYRVTAFGFRAPLFFTRLYNRLLRPGLATALPGLRAVDAPLKRAFDKIETQVNAWIDQAQFAA